jgi:hypothetical protein
MHKNGEACIQVSPFFLLRFLLQTKENPRQTRSLSGVSFARRVSGVSQRLSAQLIGKLRNPARQWRKPLALVPDRQEQPEPNRRRGCRRWKQRSVCWC